MRRKASRNEGGIAYPGLKKSESPSSSVLNALKPAPTAGLGQKARGKSAFAGLGGRLSGPAVLRGYRRILQSRVPALERRMLVESTVESHVSPPLGKSASERRTALVAKFWADPEP